MTRLNRFFPQGRRILPIGLAGLLVLALVYWHLFFGSLTAPFAKATEQPIPFSHQIHAGKYQIDCLYCHGAAAKSRIADLPSVKKCYDCHKLQGETGFLRNKAAIATHWEQKEPIAWVRVYDLPDHVYFTHRQHLEAGIECAACHGDVASRDVVRRARELKMGWCLDCHKEHKAPIECATCHI